MITGIGTDIVEVDRLAGKISKDQGFRELVFTANEINYCETKPGKFQHYAARFAAKEAFLKALGTGWITGTSFTEIEITNNENGKPSITLLGNTAQLMKQQNGDFKMSVSLSHIKTHATAIVIIENDMQ